MPLSPIERGAAEGRFLEHRMVSRRTALRKVSGKGKTRGSRHKEFAKIKPDIFLAQEVTYGKAFADLVATVPGLKVDVFSNFPGA